MAFEEKYDKVKQYASTRSLFHKFNVLNFDNYRRLTIRKFMWEISQNLHPVFIECLFTKGSEKHEIMIRSSSLSKYSLPCAGTNFRKQFINFTAVKLWNDEIPNKIKSQLKLSAFIRQCRSYLLVHTATGTGSRVFPSGGDWGGTPMSSMSPLITAVSPP